jgi:hypothetical protein
MKKLIVSFVSILIFAFNSIGQNVGVNTTTPEAALDVNGDIVIRPGGLSVADGITLALDVNAVKFSYYRVEGPTADFTLAGIAAGVDGRQLSLFNRSGFTMQLNNEDATVVATDMIVTGTNANISIPNKGIVNLQYDANEGKWIVKSSSKDAVGSGISFWDTDGTHIYNTNTGNVGIGTATPLDRLTVETDNNSYGITHRSIQGNILSTRIGGTTAGIGTFSPTDMRIFSGSLSRIIISQLTGGVFIGSDQPSVGTKLTVQTLNNSNGIEHIGQDGNILSTRIGGTSAGIGTFSNTNMRIFANGSSAIFIGSGTNNVGIGIDFPANKLEVNGSVRSKEVIVESINWPDYIFDQKHKLPLLSDVEKFIQQNKHLPNIPSAAEIESKGLHLGDTQKRMMEKIEELTLYMIDADKAIKASVKEIDELRTKLLLLEQKLTNN